jgi:hypothetical protein
MTLGSLWHLFARETKLWMLGGSVSVLAGVVVGLLAIPAFLASGSSELGLQLPSLVLSLGGGYAVVFPGLRVARTKVSIYRGWRQHPGSAKVLWILSYAVGITGLVTCILAGGISPSLPGLLVWVFMGPYLALCGWAAALLGMAANVRHLAGTVDAGDPAPARGPAQ